MKRTFPVISCVALSCLLVQPAAAWMRGGGSYGGGGPTERTGCTPCRSRTMSQARRD
jgi:hypothetical protein